MTEVVLRHPDLPGQPIIGAVAQDGTVTPNLGDAGWVIDLDTDPSAARRERPEPREPASPVTPHFAVAALAAGAEAAAAGAKELSAATAALTAALKQPAEPAKSEQAPASLNLEKE